MGVFLAYAAPRGRTFLDRALYLPESWTSDRERCVRVGVPDNVSFATKPQLALQMLKRALHERVAAAWVVGDESMATTRRCGDGWRPICNRTCWRWRARIAFGWTSNGSSALRRGFVASRFRSLMVDRSLRDHYTKDRLG